MITNLRTNRTDFKQHLITLGGLKKHKINMKHNFSYRITKQCYIGQPLGKNLRFLFLGTLFFSFAGSVLAGSVVERM